VREAADGGTGRPCEPGITGNAARNTTWPCFSGGLAAFLYEVLSSRLRYPIFPDDFPGQQPASLLKDDLTHDGSPG
jgi:hypothetical protein